MSFPTILCIISAFLAVLSHRNAARMIENYKAYKEVVYKNLKDYRQLNADMAELLEIIKSSETSDEIKRKYVIYLSYKN